MSINGMQATAGMGALDQLEEQVSPAAPDAERYAYSSGTLRQNAATTRKCEVTD